MTTFSDFMKVAQYAKDTKNLFLGFQTVNEYQFFNSGFFEVFKEKLESYVLTDIEKKAIYKSSLQGAILLYNKYI